MISACQIITRSDVPALIKDAWQFAFAPEKIVASFRDSGISPLTGLSAAGKEKRSPSLAIMAAAGIRSAQLDQSELLGSVVGREAKRRSQLHLHPLTKMQKLELENRELKQALSALKIVQSLHPEQMRDHNMPGDVAQSSLSCPGRNEGIIRARGAQHATADEWIALMEEEERKKELKKREENERARLREELRAKRAQQENAKRLYTAFYKSGPKRGLQCTTQCLPDADGIFLCGRHQYKENALLEVEAPISSQFQQASPVALELGHQEEEEELECPVALELERQEEEELGGIHFLLSLTFFIVCLVAACVHI